MSKRLQVMFEKQELAEIRAVAARNWMTVAEWVRQTLRAALGPKRMCTSQFKLDAIRKAVDNSFPIGQISEMLEEIEKGYISGHG